MISVATALKISANLLMTPPDALDFLRRSWPGAASAAVLATGVPLNRGGSKLPVPNGQIKLGYRGGSEGFGTRKNGGTALQPCRSTSR